MNISTILAFIDNGHMALPEFQRGYVWNREQVRGLFDSLYKRHPVGGLLVWATESQGAAYRGEGDLAPGVVKLLLDGQQRMTSIYGVVRGTPPDFFDGNANAFTGLRFHLESETFGFYQPIKMRDDPLWIDVSSLLQSGAAGLGSFISKLSANYSSRIGDYAARMSQLLGILEIDLHVEEITGKDKTLDIVVDIFNRVNSGGTTLSKGDLALAKICAEWPDGRDEMKLKLKEWGDQGYHFDLDWLLRSVNTVLTGEAKFTYLHNKSALEIQDALKRANRHIESCLNLISGRLGLDHDRVLFGRFAIPVMVRYLDQQGEQLDELTRDKLLFWYVQAGMWGRFYGSTETMIDQDLEALEGENGGLDHLLEKLRLWHGGNLSVEAGHFTGWSLGARFYPVLYMLTRMGEALDWGSGTELKAHLLGKMNKLEVHHIFPRAQLYKYEDCQYDKSQVNALANFCFLTKETNLRISDRKPEEYFPEIEASHPGALASQWIPMDPHLWKLENYPDFLDARKELLAAEANRQLTKLIHGDSNWLGEPVAAEQESPVVVGGITSQEEQDDLLQLNDWVTSQGLPEGQLSYDCADPDTGTQIAVFDLVWPNGLQEELSVPVAVLLNETAETVALASSLGFRCFTDTLKFKSYVQSEIVG